MDVRDLEPVLEVADVIQIGARNMQNYTLLTEVGRTGRPVLLKRGLSATLEELLMAAEYILKEGNEKVMLCERGIRTFETAYRFTLDLMAVPVLKELTHLPVIVDPSHAAGRRELVLPLSLAAAAAGADGIIVEVHPEPERRDLRRPAGARGRRVRRLPAQGRGGGGAGRQGVQTVSAPILADPRRGADRRLDRPRRPGAARRRGRRLRPGRRVLRAAVERGAIDRARRPRSPTRSRGATRLRLRARGRAAGAGGRGAGPAGPDCVVTDVGSTKRS